VYAGMTGSTIYGSSCNVVDGIMTS
jgi:hypothetical protein